MPRGRGRPMGSRGTKQVRPQGRKSSTKNCNRRQVVISLDVTSSSDEEDMSPAVTKAVPKNQLPLDLSPVISGRGLMSDSSDSDCLMVTHRSEASPKATEINTVDAKNMTFSDSDIDLYEVNYEFHHEQALKNAYREINALKENMNANSNEPLIPKDSEDQNQDQEEVITLIEDEINENKKKLVSSPTLLDLKKLPKRRRIKANDKTKQSLSKLKALSKEIKTKTSIVDNLNLSVDNEIISDNDDDVDAMINLRVKWESDYLRMPIKNGQKFSHLYQELAERFSVRANQIVLSHKDKVISSELSPKDLGLTIADIIEGGIWSQESRDMLEAAEDKNPDSIRFKVQNADRKGALNIYISRYDKMIVLMRKYAGEKSVSLEKLKFCFDGEVLDPNETPVNLDLDGDECIDVYEKL